MIKNDNERDNVFFITLIDFFIQIIFFLILVSVLFLVADKVDDTDANSIKKLKKHYNNNSFTEITDELTRLGPISDLKKAKELSAKFGGTSNLDKLEKISAQVGGFDKLMKKVEGGIGKPPCLFSVNADGKITPKSVATVIATDNELMFEQETPELSKLLSQIGYTFNEVRRLSINEFKNKFHKVSQINSDCRYYVTYKQRTRFIEPREAVEANFFIILIR